MSYSQMPGGPQFPYYLHGQFIAQPDRFLPRAIGLLVYTGISLLLSLDGQNEELLPVDDRQRDGRDSLLDRDVRHSFEHEAL